MTRLLNQEMSVADCETFLKAKQSAWLLLEHNGSHLMVTWQPDNGFLAWRHDLPIDIAECQARPSLVEALENPILDR